MKVLTIISAIKSLFTVSSQPSVSTDTDPNIQILQDTLNDLSALSFFPSHDRELAANLARGILSVSSLQDILFIQVATYDENLELREPSSHRELIMTLSSALPQEIHVSTEAPLTSELCSTQDVFLRLLLYNSEQKPTTGYLFLLAPPLITDREVGFDPVMYDQS